MNGVGGSVEGIARKASSASLIGTLCCPESRAEVGLSCAWMQLKLFASIVNYNAIAFWADLTVDFGS